MKKMINLFCFILCFAQLVTPQISRDQGVLCELSRSLQNLPPDWRCPSLNPGCSWSGITCVDNVVTEVYVVGPIYPPIGGTLPTTIGLLQNLTKLSLISMGITGTIPTQIATLPQLSTLCLNQNRFVGAIPFLNQTTVLTVKDNWITQFPSLAGVNMKYLDLSGNNISGTLPEIVTLSPLLNNLDLNSNLLEGSVPNWTAGLDFLDLSFNRMTNLVEPKGDPRLFILYPQDTDECASGTHRCTHACIDGWEPPLSYTCGCAYGQTLRPDKFSCIECLGELDPVPVDTTHTGFPSLIELGYNESVLDFVSCSSCSYGRRFFQRRIIFDPTCQPFEPFAKEYQDCEFACSNLSDVNGARESIRTLVREFQKGSFLEDVMYSFFGLNISYILPNQPGGKKRFLGIDFLDWFLVSDSFEVAFSPENSTWITNFTKFQQIRELSEGLALDIVPHAPSLTVTITVGTNVIKLRSQDPDPVTPIVLGIVISTFWTICCLGCCIYAGVRRKMWLNSPVRRLPRDVAWSYEKYENNKRKWEYRGTKSNRYYFKEFSLDSKPGRRVMDFFRTQLGGQDLKVTKIEAIYNEQLTANFVNMKSFLDQRVDTSPDLFASDNTGGNKEKGWVMEKYFEIASKYPWNVTSTGALVKVPIIPAIHGTDMATAKAISETGFAAVSLLDSGFFGKGIYFTTHANYTIPYFSTRREPAIIIAWIILGNVYPVTESHTSSQSLKGTAIQGRANSHYVVTSRNGSCIFDPRTDPKECFNEIVIGQESQIIPAYLLAISKDNIGLLLRKWKRIIPDEDAKASTSSEFSSQRVSEDSLLDQ